jgi:predicted transcriptional regulator
MTATVERHPSLEQSLGTVDAAMTREVVLLAADMTAESAVRRLDDQAVSGAPVVDHGRVVGVITRRDLLIPPRLGGLRVSDLMSGEPVTAQPDWSLVGAVRSMTGHGVNRLPVVDSAGRPLGVLTRDDVLRAVVRSCHDER